MEKNKPEIYSMPRLLKINDLNIRKIANTTQMSAAVYFNKLTQLIKRAPEGIGSLMKFIDRNGDIEAYKSLDAIIVILKELGCEAFITEFYSILGSYETGNWRLAGHYAEMVADRFNKFCSIIADAKSLPDEEIYPEAGVSLKGYMALLEKEDDNRKMIILAVDDSPVILKSVSSVLSGDYKVYTLIKPTMLENILRQITPELFLLDCKMPEISGIELIPLIRSFDEHKDTPIVFLTSESTIDNLTAALSLGACDFIVKPFNPDALRAKIAKWIVRKNRLVG